MFFNSISFAIFFTIVFILYWYFNSKSLRFQNILLLATSYFFYSCWNWHFLFLLAFSTLLDFYTGLKIGYSKTNTIRKIWLAISVTINLGFFFVFKYYNFFAESLITLFHSLGITIHLSIISVILPVGISFYTFHGLSYVFDIYNRKIKPSGDFVNYSLFVSFFPLLVAGPIERATHLLPQVEKRRNFEYSQAIDGLQQILWGLFKKVVIADNCAVYANQIFNNSYDYSGTTLFLGALMFTFQIYGDFSGYSDIALGTARLLGFELLQNFSFPYFSRDMAEFWRRWHISLSSWFRDYLYIPLGGSAVNVWKKIRNVFIIFLVSGFWHGANWTFIAWGGLNALYVIPSTLLKKNRNNMEIVAKGRLIPSLKDILNILFTFILTVFAWIFFRARTIAHALTFIRDLLKGLLYKSAYKETFHFLTHTIGWSLPILILFFVSIEWIGREQKYAIQKIIINYPSFIRYSFYYTILILIFLFAGHPEQFIYFQF